MHKENQLSTCLLLLVLGFLIYQLMKCGSSKENTDEGFAEANAPVPATPNTASTPPSPTPSTAPPPVAATTVSALPQTQTVVDSVFNFEPNDTYNNVADLDVAFQPPIPESARPDVVDINKNNVKKYDAKDFLPKEVNNQWFDTDFSQAKFNINDDKLINTDRYVIGINTVGQSLKNASYDIRGSTPCPKFAVSPWGNSTIEPDTNLKPLC